MDSKGTKESPLVVSDVGHSGKVDQGNRRIQFVIYLLCVLVSLW